MSGLGRWLRFNAIGMVGMGVQLGLLAGLNRLVPGHYLAATAAAIELTLVHNFCWHRRVTWRDRVAGGARGAWWGQMLRFQAANGMVSMVGNLVVMRALVAGCGMAVVAANLVAIGCCSVVNFGLGEWWAFAKEPGTSAPSSGKEESKIAEIVASGAGHDSVVESFEEGEGIETGEGGLRVEAEGLGASDGVAVGDGTGGRGQAVDTVGAGGEDGGVGLRVGEGKGAKKSEVLVAASAAGVGWEGDGEFAYGDEAGAGVVSSQGSTAVEQVGGGFGCGEVVGSVVDEGVESARGGETVGGLGKVVGGEDGDGWMRGERWLVRN